MLRTIRIALAAVVITAVTLLFLDFTGTMHHWFAWIPKVQLLEAVLALNVGVVVALVLLTLVFGRIYCSVVCPLGIMQDLVARLSRRVQKNRYSFSRERRWLRYGVLVVGIVCWLLGVGVVVELLAPYSTFGMIVTNVLQPVYMSLNNVLASVAEHYDSYAFYHTDVWLRSLPSLIISIGMLLVIGVLAWRGGRTWCNTICPVGTVLALLSRCSLLKVRFDTDKCRNCSLCTKNCKAACIDYKSHSVDASRCVVCGNCISVCRHGALSYSLAKQSSPVDVKPSPADVKTTPTDVKAVGGHDTPADPSRRNFLLSTALLATAALAEQKEKLVDGGLAEITDKVPPTRQTPLAPPGACSLRNLEKRCTGCQLCISECPNSVLRPSSDMLHWLMPTMSYERGFCRPECNRCSQVCPAGAIQPLAHELKASTQIGHAVWIKKNCVPLTDGVECGNCARHCPTGAIEMVPSDPADEESPYVPAVNEAVCIGCGACEYLCPARPFSAIYVEGHEVHKEL